MITVHGYNILFNKIDGENLISKNTKIILGIVGGVIILCMCVCLGGWLALKIGGNSLLETMAIDDPAEAAVLAHSMLDYTLPSGYKEQMAINFFVGKMVMIGKGETPNNDTSKPMIMIIEFPENIAMDEEEMRLQLQLQMKQNNRTRNWNMELVDQRTAVIRGKEVTLMIYEGVDENGAAMKQIMSSTFEGKNGQIMLWMGGEEAGWDQAAIDAFINSIR